MKYIVPFSQIRITDTPRVGGKNASLGQMFSKLKDVGITIPDGFAVTADAYWRYLEYNELIEPLHKAMERLVDYTDSRQVHSVGSEIRELLLGGTMPDDISKEIVAAYEELSRTYDTSTADVAVRSSATAEDLPTASFAGQQDTFLNVHGDEELIKACKKCIASLFTDRAIVYRYEHGFDHFEVALSVGVQKMVRADLASSGVAFSLDTESGFPDVVMIDSAWGLGESIVKGLVVPDEFMVYQPLLAKGYAPIVKKTLGIKKNKIVYAENNDGDPTVEVATSDEEHSSFSLTDEHVLELARNVTTIEDHYTEINGHWTPMDVEWAIDGIDGKLYIIQARPETVHARKDSAVVTRYELEKSAEEERVVATGLSIGQKIAYGPARIIEHASEIDRVQEGDILVTTMTDPDWVPAMKKAAGIITERGGRTCHAAIVGRELGTPVIVGVRDCMEVLAAGQQVTIDCSRGKTGYIYEGRVPFKQVTIDTQELAEPPVDVMVNIANPGTAFTVAFLPVAGVGLARLEFIITTEIGIHPMALVTPEVITDEKTRDAMHRRTAAYACPQSFFVQVLSQGIGMIAAAFYPKPVIVRLSDFKTNEYRNLLGGEYFEPEEANPMLGFRGASRYTSERYRDAFALECQALSRVRNEMGFSNVRIMVPFVRTVDEAQNALSELERHGLSRDHNGLEIIMMCEVPSNVILIDAFSQLFDGISIGSNDLTQLTLGVDRDSALLAELFDERDPAVKKMMEMAVAGAQRNHIYSGICGQAPSDFPEIADFLIECGIESISLNPDAVLPFLRRYSP